MEVSGQLHAPVALSLVLNKECIVFVDLIKKQNKFSSTSNSHSQISSKTLHYLTPMSHL